MDMATQQKSASDWLQEGITNYRNNPPSRYPAAFDCFLNSVILGSSQGIKYIIYMFNSPKIDDTRIKEAFQSLSNLVSQPNPQPSVICCFGMFFELVGRGGIPKNYTKAMEYYTKAAEMGDAEAFNNIGYLHRHGLGVPKDYKKAMEYYTKAAEMGVAEAFYNIGILHRNGLGVPKNYTKAMEYYTKAAEMGYAAAFNNIGILHKNGLGVPKNYTKAMEYYTKAGELGHARAFNKIAILHLGGLGVPKDYTKAMEYYTKAAEMGFAVAFNKIAILHLGGLGVPKDYTKAMENYIKAAESGHAEAFNNIGYLHYYGLGVPQNTQIAKGYFYKAKQLGYHLTYSKLSLLENYTFVDPTILDYSNHTGPFPKEIFLRIDIRSLNLSHNSLTTLPTQTIQLTSLRSLNLSHNLFTEIPPIIFSLPRLQDLNISNNPLTTLPNENTGFDSFTISASLETIRLQNRASTSPKTTPNSFFSNLQSLNISNTKIAKIPDYLLEQESLTCLTMENLELSYPPLISIIYPKITYTDTQTPEIVWKDIQRIYTPSIYPSTELSLGKIILIGNPNAGKTTFYKTLDPDSESNHHLDNSTVVFNPPLLKYNQQDRQICVYYDFAGQFRYMPTHTLFFSNTASIMYFIDLRNLHKEFLPTAIQHAIRWFLDLLPSSTTKTSLSSKTPVFFVFSHLDSLSTKDQNSFPIKYDNIHNFKPPLIFTFLKELQTKFVKHSKLKSHFDIDLTNNFGIYGFFPKNSRFFLEYDIRAPKNRFSISFQEFLSQRLEKKSFTDNFVPFIDALSEASKTQSTLCTLDQVYQLFIKICYPTTLHDNYSIFHDAPLSTHNQFFPPSTSSLPEKTNQPLEYDVTSSTFNHLKSAESESTPVDVDSIVEVPISHHILLPQKSTQISISSDFELHIRAADKLGLLWIKSSPVDQKPDLKDTGQPVCLSLSILAKLLFYLKNKEFGCTFPPIFSKLILTKKYKPLSSSGVPDYDIWNKLQVLPKMIPDFTLFKKSSFSTLMLDFLRRNKLLYSFPGTQLFSSPALCSCNNFIPPTRESSEYYAFKFLIEIKDFPSTIFAQFSLFLIKSKMGDIGRINLTSESLQELSQIIQFSDCCTKLRFPPHTFLHGITTTTYLYIFHYIPQIPMQNASSYILFIPLSQDSSHISLETTNSISISKSILQLFHTFLKDTYNTSSFRFCVPFQYLDSLRIFRNSVPRTYIPQDNIIFAYLSTPESVDTKKFMITLDKLEKLMKTTSGYQQNQIFFPIPLKTPHYGSPQSNDFLFVITTPDQLSTIETIILTKLQSYAGLPSIVLVQITMDFETNRLSDYPSDAFSNLLSGFLTEYSNWYLVGESKHSIPISGIISDLILSHHSGSCPLPKKVWILQNPLTSSLDPASNSTLSPILPLDDTSTHPTYLSPSERREYDRNLRIIGIKPSIIFSDTVSTLDDVADDFNLTHNLNVNKYERITSLKDYVNILSDFDSDFIPFVSNIYLDNFLEKWNSISVLQNRKEAMIQRRKLLDFLILIDCPSIQPPFWAYLGYPNSDLWNRQWNASDHKFQIAAKLGIKGQDMINQLQERIKYPDFKVWKKIRDIADKILPFLKRVFNTTIWVPKPLKVKRKQEHHIYSQIFGLFFGINHYPDNIPNYPTLRNCIAAKSSISQLFRKYLSKGQNGIHTIFENNMTSITKFMFFHQILTDLATIIDLPMIYDPSSTTTAEKKVLSSLKEIFIALFDPTSNAVKQALLDKAVSNQVIYFYFAGHGSRDANGFQFIVLNSLDTTDFTNKITTDPTGASDPTKLFVTDLQAPLFYAKLYKKYYISLETELLPFFDLIFKDSVFILLLDCCTTNDPNLPQVPKRFSANPNNNNHFTCFYPARTMFDGAIPDTPDSRLYEHLESFFSNPQPTLPALKKQMSSNGIPEIVYTDSQAKKLVSASLTTATNN